MAGSIDFVLLSLSATLKAVAVSLRGNVFAVLVYRYEWTETPYEFLTNENSVNTLKSSFIRKSTCHNTSTILDIKI